MCLWFLSQGAVMCQVSYRKVPSCGKDAHRMVHPCAKLPKSRIHCMPILPIARCHCVPMFPIHLCHRVPREVIAWFTPVPSCPPPCAKVAKSRCHRVQSYPSQGAIGCQVAHNNVPLLAKLPIVVDHRKVSLRAKLHCWVPLCAMLPITRCHRVPSCPSPCAKVAKSRCHLVRSCPSQGAIVC